MSSHSTFWREFFISNPTYLLSLLEVAWIHFDILIKTFNYFAKIFDTSYVADGLGKPGFASLKLKFSSYIWNERCLEDDSLATAWDARLYCSYKLFQPWQSTSWLLLDLSLSACSTVKQFSARYIYGLINDLEPETWSWGANSQYFIVNDAICQIFNVNANNVNCCWWLLCRQLAKRLCFETREQLKVYPVLIYIFTWAEIM